jgi:intein-encoded DNA endonuclease-like protein
MSVVGIDIISKRGERRKYLPLEMRMKMYEDVIELRRQRLKHKEIQEKIYKKHRKRLPISTIKDWINRKHNPFGKVNKFNEEPSPKLEYIIGTMFTDGYKYIDKKKPQYFIRLEAKDKEFAEKFAECLTKVLGRKKPYKPFFDRKRKRWIVIGCSVLLFKFLNRTLKELKTIIEYDEKCVSAFLQALFDSEGSIHIKIKGRKRRRQLYLCNTNRKLLIYAKYLLKKYFDVDSSGPHLVRKKGNIVHFPNGKIAKTNKDYYYLYVRTKSFLNFYRHVGFSIKRKQQRLIKAIQW